MQNEDTKNNSFIIFYFQLLIAILLKLTYNTLIMINLSPNNIAESAIVRINSFNLDKSQKINTISLIDSELKTIIVSLNLAERNLDSRKKQQEIVSEFTASINQVLRALELKKTVNY